MKIRTVDSTLPEWQCDCGRWHYPPDSPREQGKKLNKGRLLCRCGQIFKHSSWVPSALWYGYDEAVLEGKERARSLDLAEQERFFAEREANAAAAELATWGHTSRNWRQPARADVLAAWQRFYASRNVEIVARAQAAA